MTLEADYLDALRRRLCHCAEDESMIIYHEQLLHVRLLELSEADVQRAQILLLVIIKALEDLAGYLEAEAPARLLLQEMAQVAEEAWR